MIAYAFWHWPAPGAAGYEQRLGEFLAALEAEKPAGFLGASSFRTGSAPWLPGPAFLDGYRIGGFADLEALNEGAVTASRKVPHDAIAALAAGGAGGIYRHKAGPDDVRPFKFAHWLGKPSGMRYDELFAVLRDVPGSLWMRQMVLGSSPEFALFTEESVPVPATRMAIARIWPI
jgi:hypothetical protein